MKRFFLTAMLVTATALWAGTSNAGKPIKNNDGVLEYLGNGFPSGPHFNLYRTRFLRHKFVSCGGPE